VQAIAVRGEDCAATLGEDGVVRFWRDGRCARAASAVHAPASPYSEDFSALWMEGDARALLSTGSAVVLVE